MPSSRTLASKEKDSPRNASAAVLGIFKKWDCEIRERILCPGDTFARYTGGMIESFNEVRDEFGEARLIASLRRHGSLPSQSIFHSIVAGVRQFAPRELHSDITLIIAKSVHPQPPANRPQQSSV
jgi:serine phosphatase RsbU (regulator of sigma subunit)